MPVDKYFHGGGKKVMANMKKQYGDKKGESVFYATANKRGVGPSDKVKNQSKKKHRMKYVN